MLKSMRIVGVVVLTLSLAVLLLGCPKRGPEPGEVTGPAGPRPAAGPEQVPSAEKPAATPETLAEAIDSRQMITSYEMTMTNPEGQTITQLMKFAEGKPVRMKMTHENEWVIMDMAERVMYAYSSEQKIAMKIAMEGEDGAEGEQMPAPTVDEFDSATPITGTETLDGVACWVMEAAPQGEAEKVKIWIDRDYSLIRQMQAGEELVKFEYDRINAVPDSEFNLPKGVKVMDMGEMMEEMMKELPQGSE